ncbi:MAG: hypothetical protein LIO99_06965, partial [Clostridiales bacterium]|nr:hypothetical protein [Clostridiales bacterium]
EQADSIVIGAGAGLSTSAGFVYNGDQFYNTPVIIKYPFWQMTAKNPKAIYVCINRGEALCPHEIERQSICMDADIGNVINQLKKL